MKKIFKAVCLAAIFLLPLVGCNDNPDTEEITIQKQIDAGGTVDLKNEVVSEDVTINKTVTLKNADFNGHTITVNANTTLIDVTNANIIIAGNNTSREAVAEKAISLKISGNSSITSITVKTSNARIESGETVTIVSLEVTAEAENVAISGGTIKTITSTASIVLTISGKTTIEKIDETIKVTVSGSDVKLPPTVKPLSIKSATLIKGTNVKTKYEVGDSFDFTGLSVEVTYSDNKTKSTIPLSNENTKLTGFQTSKEGTATVSFKYNGISLSDTLSITVEPSTKDYVKLINDAVDYFADLKLDEGIEKIKKAYESEKNDTTKMYYALAKLALISTDNDTVKFIKETCGFESYPNKLNALIDADWWEDCLQEGFAEKVAKANANGLNGALNKLVDIFKKTYNEVVEISKDMGQSSVLLPAVLIDALGIEDFFGTSDIRVGKAELDVVIAAMGIIKGIFEYISAFDWTFKTETISSDMDIDDFITAVQSGTKLLTTTNASRLAESKQSFIDATDMVISAYDYIIYESDIYPSDVKDTLKEYRIFYEAAKTFKDALENDRIFYVPDTDIFELEKWPTSGIGDYIVKIDCAKMFSSGVLDSAIEKDSSGKVKFYTIYSGYTSYYDEDKKSWVWDDVQFLYSNGMLLTENFSSVHKRNEAEIKNKIPKNATNSSWDCNTYLCIKVKLPDFITISGIEDNERETFLDIWGEYSDSYDYE